MIAAGAVVMALAAEALALYGFGEWVAGGADGPTVAAWVLVLVAVAGYYLPRALDTLEWSERARTVLGAVLTFAVVYGGMREATARDLHIWDFGWAGEFLRSPGEALAGRGGGVFNAVLVVIAWTRSAYRSRGDIELETMPRALSVPLVLMTILVVVAAPSPHAGEVARAGLVFYAAAVLALAFSQLALSGATFGDVRAGGVTAALLAGMTLVTLAGVALIAGLFGLLGPPLGPPLGRGAEFVLLVVLTPPAWIIQHLMEFLLAGRNPLPNLTQQARQTAQDAGDSGGHEPSSFHLAVVYFWRAVGLALMLAVVAAATGAFLWLRRTRTHEGSATAERESAGGPGDDIRGLFRRVFRRAPRGHVAGSLSPAQRLYLDVLARAERTGHARPPGTTPGEFAPELSDAFHTTITDDITRAFEQARYAGREPGAAEVAELERRWRELR